MTTRSHRRTSFPGLALWALGTLTLALPASAADLTGTWKGRFKCSSLLNNGKSRNFEEKDSVLRIIQYGDQTFDASVDGIAFCGRMIEKSNKKGVAVLIVQGTDQDPRTYSEIEHLEWKLKAGRKKVDKISKDGIFTDSDSIGQCTGSWKRTDKEAPLIPSESCFAGDL